MHEGRPRGLLAIGAAGAVALAAAGWAALYFGYGACSDAADGSSAQRYCDFVDELEPALRVGIFAAVTLAPLSALVGGVVAVRRGRGGPLFVGAALGLAALLGAALPFRLA